MAGATQSPVSDGTGGHLPRKIFLNSWSQQPSFPDNIARIPELRGLALPYRRLNIYWCHVIICKHSLAQLISGESPTEGFALTCGHLRVNLDSSPNTVRPVPTLRIPEILAYAEIVATSVVSFPKIGGQFCCVGFSGLNAPTRAHGWGWEVGGVRPILGGLGPVL